MLGLALVVAALLGADERLSDWAARLAAHATHAWAAQLSGVLFRVTTPRGLEVVAAALVADGAFTSFEGWSLYRGYAFAPWLVVIATASFLPFEIYEMAEGLRLGKVLLLAVNVAVVVYLVRRTLRERRGD